MTENVPRGFRREGGRTPARGGEEDLSNVTERINEEAKSPPEADALNSACVKTRRTSKLHWGTGTDTDNPSFAFFCFDFLVVFFPCLYLFWMDGWGGGALGDKMGITI